MTGYFKRDIAPIIFESLNEMPAVAITGMRQTGKSTFLQMEEGLKNRRYISFDDFAFLEAARENPEGFLLNDEPITIDEVQRCPEILTVIKKIIDKKRRPGQFLLSSSANFALLKGISESLAGRCVYFNLHPFTRREISQELKEPFLKSFFKTQEIPKDKKAIPIKQEEVLKGGMPPVSLYKINKNFWFKGYEQTYLERDIRDLSQIANIIPFRHLLHLVSLRTAQLLNLSQLARDAKLNSVTTTRYLSLLEASFVMNRLAPYLKNRTSRLIKSPKVYLSDSGLASYLSGIENLDQEPLKGAMIETYIAQNLLSIIDSRWHNARLYFWNIQGRYEVDFVIEVGNKCIAIEVKASERWEKRDISGLRAFLSVTPSCIACIFAYNGTEAVRLSEQIWAIPLDIVIS